LLITDHVFDETMTTMKARMGLNVALQLGVRLRNGRFAEIVVCSPGDVRANAIRPYTPQANPCGRSALFSTHHLELQIC